MKIVHCLAIFASMAATSAISATYPDNFVWHRSVDWTPGTVAGTSLGNPDPDLNGVPTWRYGSLSGGSFESANPWYKNDIHLGVWDDVWWGSSVAGVWARDYFGPAADNVNANPPVNRYGMSHDLSEFTHSYEHYPVFDWLNPVGNGAILNVSGSLTFAWRGSTFGLDVGGSPLAPVDGVVAKYDASTDSFQTLWSERLDNPKAGAYLDATSKVVVPMTFVGIRFDQGDYLRVTFRADTPESEIPLWVTMGDQLVMRLVSVVPEPSTGWLSLIGGLVLFAGVGRMRRAGAGTV